MSLDPFDDAKVQHLKTAFRVFPSFTELLPFYSPETHFSRENLDFYLYLCTDLINNSLNFTHYAKQSFCIQTFRTCSVLLSGSETHVSLGEIQGLDGCQCPPATTAFPHAPHVHASGGTAYLRRLGRALSVTALRKIRESYFSLRAICHTDNWLLFFRVRHPDCQFPFGNNGDRGHGDRKLFQKDKTYLLI